MTAALDTLSGDIVLTSAQRAALDADEVDGSDRSSLVAVYPGVLDLDALTQALMELRRRHDVLRTTVRKADDGPVGTAGLRTVVPVELMAGRPRPPVEGFPHERFDLESGPLMHVALSSEGGGRTFLRFEAHPVVLDEETLRRAVHELGLLYRYFAGEGTVPPVTRIGYWEYAAGVRSTAGRVPSRMPVVSQEIVPATADRVRLIASSRGLPIALLVLAAWITAGGTAGAAVATSLPGLTGRRPLGPACDRVLLRTDAVSAGDIVALAEHLHAATGDAEPDDGSTPVTFTCDDDRAGVDASPFEVVEMGTMLAPSEVSLATVRTPAACLLLRLAHRADVAERMADEAALVRTVTLLEEAGTALVDEELL